MYNQNDQTCHVNCISWTGVFAGALVAVGLSFLLNLFAVAIGLSAFTTSAEGVATFAIGGYLGMLVGVISIMYFAGWVAGYLGRPFCSNKNLGALYGFVAWCVALVILVLLVAQTSQFTTVNLNTVTNNHPTVSRLVNNVSNAQSPNVTYKEAQARKLDQTTVSDEEAAKALGLSLFLTFALFFIGAVASGFGGYCGACVCKGRE